MAKIFNQFKTVILLSVLTALMLLIGNMFGKTGFYVAITFVLIMNLVTYFFAHKIVLMIYKAKPAKEKDYPKLYKIIREVTHMAKIPMPKVYIIPSKNPNAFASGRNPKNAIIAVTDGIMTLLTEDELKGVIAHEIAHIRNRDILIQTIAGTIAGVISYIASMAQWAAIFGFGGDDEDGGGIIGLLLIAILAPLIAIILQLAISRSREYLADETGAKIISNPKTLASALEKLEKGIEKEPMRFGNNSTSSLFIANPFNAKGVFALFSTHPPLHERVRRLKAMKF